VSEWKWPPSARAHARSVLRGQTISALGTTALHQQVAADQKQGISLARSLNEAVQRIDEGAVQLMAISLYGSPPGYPAKGGSRW